jgi:hypothetical protein
MVAAKAKRRVFVYSVIGVTLVGEAVCLYWLGVRHDWAASTLIVAGWVKHAVAKVFEEVGHL